MQCPACGYDGIHEEACFCPRCRYQFQVPDDGPLPETWAPEPPASAPLRRKGEEKFTRKEIRQMKIQLLPSTLILMLTILLLISVSYPRVSQLMITISGVNFPLGGLLSLGIAAVVAGIFHFLVSLNLEHA